MTDTDKLISDSTTRKPGSTLELIAAVGAALSPTQRAFQRHVDNIALAELRVKELDALLSVYRARFQQKMDVLEDDQIKVNREMVMFLDAQLLRSGWTANQRDTMKEIFFRTVETLFDTPVHDEVELIFNRHSDLSLKEINEIKVNAMEAELAGIYGMQPADGRDNAGENTGENAARTTEEKLLDALRFLKEKEEAEVLNDARADAKRKNKKSAKPSKAEQQAVDTEKLLKDIYRKLTSLLHPDREPDEAERKRKTALMTEANKAYENRNLLALLQLQLAATKLDSRAAATMADAQLKIVNQRLAMQLNELEQESLQLEMLMREEFMVGFLVALRPESIEKSLKVTVADCARRIKNKRRILALIQQSDKLFKQWLKEERATINEKRRHEMLYEEAMAGYMMDESRAKPKRGRK